MSQKAIKSEFSIKDLENLSGVKAHTIRIWEKRYNLLQPNRSDTNIRNYDLNNLTKLLNVSILNAHGFKISKIADLGEDEIMQKVKELVISNNTHHAINAFKIAMVTFDSELFDRTYNQLLTQHSFREIFLEIFVELLQQMGYLWQTKTITPAQEHFISTLIKQKILINVERIQNGGHRSDKTYILFLPVNEIHDIGLLYIHFELLLKGLKSIYLGSSVPIDNLAETQKIFKKTEFVSYFTVEPSIETVEEYLQEFDQVILQERGEKLHLLGKNAMNTASLKNVIKYQSIPEAIESI